LCNEEEFTKAAPEYKEALLKSGYNGGLEYVKTRSSAKRSRKRNIVWFNPPYSDHVKTNIRRKFLRLVAIHFPPHHRLHKICNKNNIKVSYSCMPNMAAIISRHNKKVFQHRTDPCRTTPPCNCRDNPTVHWKEVAVLARSSIKPLSTPVALPDTIMVVVKRSSKPVSTTIIRASSIDTKEITPSC